MMMKIFSGKIMLVLLVIGLGWIAESAKSNEPVILLEAEQFADTGGWVVDQQFMDQMGSPYLLAHGLGVPVRDAVTTVTFPEACTYHVWVRTRDWVAPWKAPGAPGKFQLLLNGQPLATMFGTEGAVWHWQDDSGGPFAYNNRTFSPERYTYKILNSVGHPVPVVAGQLQRDATKVHPRVLKTSFNDDQD
jgi:hypothetical protein